MTQQFHVLLAILDGTSVFRGTRVSVNALLRNLEAGVSII